MSDETEEKDAQYTVKTFQDTKGVEVTKVRNETSSPVAAERSDAIKGRDEDAGSKNKRR